MIHIDGLNKEQCDMLDVIWGFKTKEDYLNWYDCLDEAEQDMADGLLQLLALAILDESQEEMDDPYREAKMVIQNIKSKFDTK
jgi:hypothetical protein